MPCFIPTARLLIAFLCGALIANLSLAQPPDRLTEYRFLSRHSTLDVEGGFAGFDIEANIFGTFGFVEGFRFEFPTLEPYAAFIDVRAKAINPTDFGPYSFDLDQSLNLTGLKGKPLPVAAPFDVFKFRGEDGQGAPMDLTVIKLGRWLYMHGANDPGCCDFFNYEIEAIARRTPYADFTEDDRVDAADAAAWISAYGTSAGGDANGDADSDGDDFLNWQRQLGETMPSLETFAALAALGAESASLSSVPEPSALFLLISMGLAGICLRRR